MQRVHIIVKGIVQGVFFRENTKNIAKKLGLKGYAKNLSDGTVEVIAEGNKKELEELIEFCKVGPSSARVDDINIEFDNPKNEFKEFQVKY